MKKSALSQLLSSEWCSDPWLKTRNSVLHKSRALLWLWKRPARQNHPDEHFLCFSMTTELDTSFQARLPISPLSRPSTLSPITYPCNTPHLLDERKKWLLCKTSCVVKI